ncbi:hypothetical protein [Paraburkholderia sp.]|uniref:hypothetical protein n=1 Tax=Paraburkholderia sp. TaxID=1926495 RepID=UPI00238CA9A6|nr:hypothetical protein [Paraburkholderia sp.]MDE1181496.1 hypothetical protein [Paraburkholderia sp.]
MLPETSKNLHDEQPGKAGAEYPLAIAIALKKDFGSSRRTIKSLERWTGASGRTVQNWLSAVRGPSGPHLVALAKHSPSVHFAYLVLAGRADTTGRDIDTAMKLIREAMALLSGNN